MMVDTNSVEDLQWQLISKLGISNDISRLEYFDNEFGDYVTLVDLEELPQMPRIRLVTVTESFLPFGHFANDHGWKPMGYQSTQYQSFLLKDGKEEVEEKKDDPQIKANNGKLCVICEEKPVQMVGIFETDN